MNFRYSLDLYNRARFAAQLTFFLLVLGKQIVSSEELVEQNLNVSIDEKRFTGYRKLTSERPRWLRYVMIEFGSRNGHLGYFKVAIIVRVFCANLMLRSIGKRTHATMKSFFVMPGSFTYSFIPRVNITDHAVSNNRRTKVTDQQMNLEFRPPLC